MQANNISLHTFHRYSVRLACLNFDMMRGNKMYINVRLFSQFFFRMSGLKYHFSVVDSFLSHRINSSSSTFSSL